MVRLALIGCGRIAQLVHLRVLSRLPEAQLVALADPEPERLREARERVPTARTYTDYRELLTSADAEAVVLALPPFLHAEAATAAFAAGKHVYLEKPGATTPAEAEAVLQGWRSAGTVGMVGVNQRFHPAHRALRGAIREGRIGEIVGARTVFCAAARELPAWKRSRSTGGGVLLDLAIHHVDLARFLFDTEVEAVTADVRSVRSEGDTALLDLRLATGAFVQCFVSMSAVEQDRFEVYGTGGRLRVDRYGSGRLEFTPPRRPRGRAAQVRALLAGAPARLREVVRPASDPSHARALAAFVEAVRQRDPAAVPGPDDAFRSLAVVFAAEHSAGSGQAAAPPAFAAHSSSSPEEAARRQLRTDNDTQDMQATTKPEMSVVLVTAGRFDLIRRTLRHLSEQTTADRLEVILVAPDEQALAACDAARTERFWGSERVYVGPIADVDKAAAPGIARARADIVALVEDHAYPEPGWAAALIAAHRRGPWAAVGSAVANANPQSAFSWTNQLMAYGDWTEPVRGGETYNVSRHNVSFKKAALDPYGERLVDYLGRGGGLLEDLQRRGHRFYLEPAARIRHANPSRFASTVRLRFFAGRLSGASKARRGNWPATRRAAYFVGAPLIPLLRFRLIGRKLLAPQNRALAPRVLPALALGLTLDGVGQMLGFGFGPGSTESRLADFEMDRFRHMTEDDRRLLAE